MPRSYAIWKVAQQLGMWPGHLEWLIDEGGGSDWWAKLTKMMELEGALGQAQSIPDRVYRQK